MFDLRCACRCLSLVVVGLVGCLQAFLPLAGSPVLHPRFPQSQQITLLLTSRGSAPLCMIFFNFLPISMHLLPTFNLDLQHVFTSLSPVSGQACLLFKVISSTNALDTYAFLSTCSGAFISHLFSLQSSSLQLVKSSISLHSQISAVTACPLVPWSSRKSHLRLLVSASPCALRFLLHQCVSLLDTLNI